MTIHSLLSNKAYSHKKVLEKLIAHRLDKNTMRVLAHLDHEIFDKDLEWIQTSYHSYAVEKQPLEYILGHVSFLGYDFMVDRNTLIPRPETEYMITAVLKELQATGYKPHDQNEAWSMKHATLIDVGTGCGVLGLSCILHGADSLDQVYLTEFYPETLEVARRNLEHYKLQAAGRKLQASKEEWDSQHEARSSVSDILNTTQLIHCSLLDHPTLKNIIAWDLKHEAWSIFIVANLPYIPEQLFEDNVEDNVKLREPKPAFVGGEDGLDWYRIMLTQIIEYKSHATSHTLQAWSIEHEAYSIQLVAFLEMMTRQVEILSREFKNHFSFEEVATFHMNIRIVKCILL
jgi:methylase of polypeptide subunit release factors